MGNAIRLPVTFGMGNIWNEHVFYLFFDFLKVVSSIQQVGYTLQYD